MANIKEFLSNGSGYGYGNGSGYGSGYGDGYGCGDGYGYGYGNGYGHGDGYGDGYGYGDGNGYGYGCVDEIESVNGFEVYVIDDIQTIITHVHGNIAKGYILKEDMSLRPCYIVKSGTYFAHGDTAREACAELEQKIIANMNTEERIKMFLDHFQDHTKKYPARELFEWHNKLTGSCTPGRQEFATAHGIDIDTAEYTVQEFIDLTRDAYGGKVIREIERKINEKL